MDKEQCRAAKAQLVTGMQAFRQRGETALSDGRHGHPIKVRGEVRTFLEAACRRDPSTLSSTIQAALRERFDLNVSISQINRVRAALGVSTRPAEPATGKKM